MSTSLIEINQVNKQFNLNGKMLQALNNVDLCINRGEILGLVGESGCGKSTLGKAILQLEKVDRGEILFDGLNLGSLPKKEMRALRRRMQMIFQNPYSSLNPRMTVKEIIGEALEIHGLKGDVGELLGLVELSSDYLTRYPHELSGGQRQRVGIARALAVEPEFIVCDEPLSALDAIVRGQIIKLLKVLQRNLGLTYLFITHDLPMLENFADRIAVMYSGQIVELAPAKELLQNPRHPYTQALIAAIP